MAKNIFFVKEESQMGITAGSERYSSSQTFLASEKKWRLTAAARLYFLSGTENVYKNILSSIISYISQTLPDQGGTTI